MSEIFSVGKEGAPIVVVTDWSLPSAKQRGQIMPDAHLNFFMSRMKEAGLSMRDCVFVNPCPMNPAWIKGKPPTEKQYGLWVDPYQEEFKQILTKVSKGSKVILGLGKSAARQLYGKSVKVTKVRGTFGVCANSKLKVMMTLSPAHALSRPEVKRDFDTDLRMIADYQRSGWSGDPSAKSLGKYEICTDLSDWLRDPPPLLSVDTETTGLQWANDATILCIPLTAEEGGSRVVPVNGTLFKDIPIGDRRHVVGQVRKLLANPDIKVFGHNFKFDLHMLSLMKIHVANWWMDTLQLVFALDENMLSKSLKEATRRWVPAMAGYCVAPDTKLLARDLSKVRAGDVKVGDELVGFDENPARKQQRRKMRVATVLRVTTLRKPSYRVKTSRGREFVVSHNHQFLTKNTKGGNWGWRSIVSMKTGDTLKPFPFEDHDKSFESGYMSGILDGEGWITRRKEVGLFRMGFAQVDGLVLTQSLATINEKLGCSVSVLPDNRKKEKPCYNCVMGSWDTFRALQKFRPARLLAKEAWVDKPLPDCRDIDGVYDFITELEYVGEHEVVAIKTTTKTFIAEGVCSHNSDVFDAETDKGKLIEAKMEDVVKYAGGDTDATFRLCRALVEELMRDKRQWRTVTRVQMPALRMFYRMEKQGMSVDTRRLRELGVVMTTRAYELESQLLRAVPKKVKQKHFDQGLSFGRKEFLQDILFSRDGFNLRVHSKIANGSPSTDAIHLSFHADHPFVQSYTEFQKVSKMRSTYVGEESATVITEIATLKNGGWPVAIRRLTNYEPEQLQELAKLEKITGCTKDGEDLKVHRVTEWESDGSCLAIANGVTYRVTQSAPTGFWRHLLAGNKIHPTFFLDKTVTGRTSSRDPNFQNVPKRGPLAKPFRKVFVPSIRGNVFFECDLSQAELRIAACESLDPVMMRTYREGGDIHSLTASKVALVKLANVTPEMRQKAKAVNFGFLYTMGVDGFIIYAKTQYGVTFTKEEAAAIRNTYFQTYANLPKWHDRRRQEVRRDGHVRALHGARRNLPSIHSADRGVQAEAERQAINSPVQRFASDITLMAMVQFSEGCPSWALPIGTVHDSGIIEAPEAKTKKVASWLKWCFVNPPLERLFGIRLPIPLDADVSVGPNLGEMSEMKGVIAVKPPWIVI